MPRPLSVSAILLLTALAAHGRDWFVSPTGQDGARDSSEARPFQSIERGLAAAQPGDRVVLRAGEYRLAAPLVFPRAGERDRPITLAAQKGEYVALLGSVRLSGWVKHQGGVWKAKAPSRQVKGLFEDGERLVHPRERGKREDPPVEALRAPGRWTQQDGWVYLWTRDGDSPDRHRVEASQYVVMNLNRPWLRIEGLHLFYGQPTGVVISADHCVVSKCEVAGVSNSVDNAYGAYLSGCSNSAFRDCVVHDCFYWGDHGSNSHVVSCIDCGDQGPNHVEGCELSNGGLGVGTKGAARQMIIAGCRIYDVLNGVVISGERSSGPGAGKKDRGHYLVWRNCFTDCDRGVFFYSGDTHENTVAGNLFERCGTGVYLRKVEGVPDRPLIANNAFLRCGSALFAVAERAGAETLSQFAQAGLRSHHNLFFGNEADWRNPLTWGKDLTLAFAEARAYKGFGWEEGSVGGDPQLDEWGRATAGSPTVGAGAPVELPASIPRPDAWHIGLGPWRAGEERPEPGLVLSVAGSQDAVGPGDQVKLRAALTNRFRTTEVPLDGDAIVTFHFRYANVWYFDCQELWRVRVPLPGGVLRPGGSLDLAALPGWQNPTNGKLGDPFRLRADDAESRSGWRLSATLRRVPRDVPTDKALQRLEPLIRSRGILRIRAK
ncbi:MAG TPA: right-handed parallel beta-helix repeat-containing protein [Planctomycetota bacterium]|nr:right-handed parallel beta-helix repeat-containing protein [Planctomycetota bacterium]HRR80755.1 right-handed parallel beta-helix repeat-containing protein [Planctomycetota bacterium]HRT94394.1 right-handed parallel beta-helix repeat-containing protein [Planctomycetota bacterium]